MNVKDVLAKCIPVLFKKDLNDALYNITKELDESTIPIFKEAMRNFSLHEFRSPEVKIKQATFNSIVKTKRKDNIIITISDRLVNLRKLLQRVQQYIPRNFEDTTSSSALTYKKAQYLQLLDYVKFYMSYSRKLLNYILVAESGAGSLQNKLTPNQLATVEDNFQAFCQLSEIFSQDEMTVILKLEAIPDRIVVPESEDIIESSYGKDKLDPLRLSFVSTTFNPFYAIQIRRAINAHRSYEAAIEERELLKLKLLQLQRQNDPNLADQVEKIQNTLNKLEYRIAKEDELYG